MFRIPMWGNVKCSYLLLLLHSNTYISVSSSWEGFTAHRHTGLDSCLPAVNQSSYNTVGILCGETITCGERTLCLHLFLTNVLCHTWTEYWMGPYLAGSRFLYSFIKWASWLDTSVSCWWSACFPSPHFFLSVSDWQLDTHTYTYTHNVILLTRA